VVLTGTAATDAAAAGETARAPEPSSKPFFVVVSEVEGDDVSKIDGVILKDERVALGARAFRAVRLTTEDAAADPLLAKAGKEPTRIVLVSADWKTVTPLEKNKLSVSATWDAMKVHASKFYGKSLDSTVKTMRGLMLEFDKIDGERTILQAKEDRLKEKKGSDAELAEVQAKRTALEERQKAAEEKEKSLGDLQPKSA
jgi:hypothetical protein